MATIFDFNTPFGMVNSQPNIGPITPMTPMTPQPAKDRTGLATMLFALGGALRGDKDFVAKAIQLKEMKESKEKKNQQSIAVKKYIADNPDIPQSMKSLLNVMSPDQVITTLTKTLETKPTGPLVQIVDQEGKFVMNMTREEAAVNTDEFKKRGFRITNIPTGTDPAPSNIEATNKLIEPIKEQFIASEKLIKGLNETGKILAENPEAANKLVAGGASAYTFITSNIAGFQSLIDNNKDTKAYQDLQKASVSLEGNDYAQKIKDVALASNISESRIKDLAFAFAAARGQTGRGLSDRDFQNALDILSKGVNAEQKIALFADVAQRIQSDYQIVSELAKRMNVKNPDVVNQINAIGSLSPFVNPFTQPSTTQTTSSIEDILKKYPPKG